MILTQSGSNCFVILRDFFFLSQRKKLFKAIISCALILFASLPHSCPCWTSPTNVSQSDHPSLVHLEVEKFEIQISKTCRIQVITICACDVQVMAGAKWLFVCGSLSLNEPNNVNNTTSPTFPILTSIDSINDSQLGSWRLKI